LSEIYFKISQKKLELMFKKLLCTDMFKSNIITQKDGKLFSVQTGGHGRAIQVLKFNNSFFTEISKSTLSIEIETKRIYEIVKDVSQKEFITVTAKDNEFIIETSKEEFYFAFCPPRDEIKTSLPFPMKKGIPVVGEQEIKLDTHFVIDVESFKHISKYMDKFKTEFCIFFYDQNQVKVRIGALDDFSDYMIYQPKYRIKTGKKLHVIVPYGIKQIANSFDNMIQIRTKTDSPLWIYEGTNDYVHGIFMAPFVY